MSAIFISKNYLGNSQRELLFLLRRGCTSPTFTGPEPRQLLHLVKGYRISQNGFFNCIKLCKSDLEERPRFGLLVHSILHKKTEIFVSEPFKLMAGSCSFAVTLSYNSQLFITLDSN